MELDLFTHPYKALMDIANNDVQSYKDWDAAMKAEAKLESETRRGLRQPAKAVLENANPSLG